MKVITAKVTIQFDQDTDGDPVEYTKDILEGINHVIQNAYDDISPLIFTNGLDHSDIEVTTPEDEEIED